MSITNSLVVAAQDTATVVTQNAAAAVAEVVGKGGFSANATLGQLVEFQLTGLLVVFTVLGGLTLMCVLMAWLLKTLAPDQYYCRKAADQPAATPKPAPVAAQSPAATAPSVAAASIHPGLADEELIVILAAAATEAVGQAVSIVKFRQMDRAGWAWSEQGRVGQHTSHQR